MYKKPITITISRQFGSNGREIGRLLSKKLGIGYYDKEIMSQIAKDMHIDPAYFEEEYRNDAGFFSISNHNSALVNMTELSLNSKVYEKGSELIRKIASEESSVIIGRCGDYVLKEQEDVIRVFCYCDLETRIRFAQDNYDIKDRKIRKFVDTQDKRRSGFYQFYTNQTWGDPSNYDVMINTAHVSADEAVALLKAIYDEKLNNSDKSL